MKGWWCVGFVGKGGIRTPEAVESLGKYCHLCEVVPYFGGG